MARDLLGKSVHLRRGDRLRTAAIVETEAYTPDDPASHSYRGLTTRNAVMFGPPGFAYVYFIYGMHYCLNAVTEGEGIGSAVLIRAVEGIDGPGRVCRHFGIDLAMNGWDLTSSELRIVEGPMIPDARVAVSRRIGISKGAELPRRFQTV